MYPTKPLGEICDIKTGKKDANYGDNGGDYRFYTCASEPIKSPTYSFEGPSIILPGNGANVGLVLYYDGKFEAYQRTYILNNFLDSISIFYVKYFLTYFWKRYLSNKQLGSATNYIVIGTIQKADIPLPPLPTQKLIVQKLDLAFENIDKNINLTKENLKNLEDLNKSVLEKVFSEGEYEKVDLIKIASFSNKTTLPKDGDLYNYIGLENIESNTGKLVNFKETLGKEIRSNKVIFKNGMVLYGKLRPYLNKVIVSEFDGVATTEILPIECTDKLYNYYLGYFLRTDYFVNLANINISGARMPRVTTKFLKEEIQIPLPPLQKQKEIVSYLDEVFAKNKELKTKYELQLKELEELKQSLLKDAFEGRLVKE